MDHPAPQRGFSAGGPLVIATDRCVNSGNRHVACTRCVDSCPVSAIAVDGPAVLDVSACIDCGACMPACPTEAIGPRKAGRYLHFAIADLPPGEPPVISCPRATAEESAFNAVRYDRCLAALGAEELFTLAGETSRELWLDDSACATCELDPLHRTIESAARDANALLERVGREPAVHLEAIRSATPLSGKPAVQPDNRSGAISRRGLFRRLIGGVVERVAVETGQKSLPRRRQAFLRTLQSMHPHPFTDALPSVAVRGFGDVVVDADQCSACGLCAQFCPTGALALDATTADGRDTFDLSVQAGRCVDCGVCTAACPESAIAVVSRVDVSALLDRSSKTVASGRLVPCEACGMPVASSPGRSPRCFGCRGGVVTPLRDELGLMADLLGRVPPTA